MNILIKGLYPRLSSPNDTTQALLSCIDHISRIAAVIRDKWPDQNNIVFVIEFDYPPGGGFGASVKLEITATLPISEEFRTVTGLSGPVKVAEKSLEVRLAEVMNAEQITFEATRLLACLK